jgi:hypothetical protein
MILKSIFYVIKYIIAVPSMLSNWIAVTIFKKHLKFEFFQEIKKNESSKFALIASFPGTSTFLSLHRQIQIFARYGYNVILILNKNSKSKDWAERLSGINCSIVLRDNIGADFGAFKCIAKYLQKEYKDSISQIILANDSLYYTPDAFKGLSLILKDNSEFNCLFFNRQGIRHAGSMLLKFDFTEIEQDAFWKFWGNYYPYSIKNQVVRKGEHKLTQAFDSNYFRPLVNMQSIDKKFVKLETTELVQAVVWSKLSNKLIHQQIELSRQLVDHRRILEFCISNLQVSNSIGLWATRIFVIPFKLDLPQVGLATISDLLKLAKLHGCEEEEIREIRILLQSRPNITEGSYLKNMLRVI